ncbi:MAG: VOC family protein [Pseudomonadota bacterium]
MTVRRIVAHVHSDKPQELAAFYRAVFALETKMDQAWIVTLGAGEGPVQLSLTAHGGAPAPRPHLTLEVADLEATLARAKAQGADVLYGPKVEDWGVTRFMIADPAGTILNVMAHSP